MKNRQGYYETETERQCTSCGTIFEKTSRTVALCNKCNSSRVRAIDPKWRMHQRAKMRSKTTGKEFNLDVSDIVIPEVCPILGIPLEFNSTPGGKYNSPALDRIDNSKGYTKSNTQVISNRANQMKSDADINELRMFARWVFETFGTE